MINFMHNEKRALSYCAVLFVSVLLSSCGGGGSTAPAIDSQVQTSTSVSTEELRPGINTLSQVIDGEVVERTYSIRYPAVTSQDSYPVVFFFHGAGSDGASWLDANAQVAELIEAGEFIGIFPDGYDSAWNVSGETLADDVEFISMIVNAMDPNGLFDLDRVYGVGTSNGAGLVNKLAKETTLFTAIAPILSQQTEAVAEIVASTAVSVFQVNGADDDLVPIEGGNGVADTLFMSAQGSAENWALGFSCNMTPNQKTRQWGDFSVLEYTFSGCIDNQIIRYAVVEGLGHSTSLGEADDLYQIVWAFFKAIGVESALDVKLLALGDSYTIGQGVCGSCSFPQQLKSSLASDLLVRDILSLQVIAQTGWTTTDLKAAIVSENPASDFDLVTLLIGVNNEVQGVPMDVYEREFDELVQSAISFAGGDANRLIVVSIPDYTFTSFGSSFSSSNTSRELQEYNNFAQEYCETRDIAYVYITDITQQGLQKPELVSADRLHPSELAYGLFVERILPIALEVLE